MVGRLIEEEYIGAGDHHLGQHAADLFASGQNAYPFYTIIAAKKHTSQKSADIGDILFLGVLCQPFHNGVIIVKLCSVVLGEIGLRSGDTPFVGSGVGLHLAHENLKKRGLGKLIASDKCHLVVMVQGEGDIVQHLFAVNGFA